MFLPELLPESCGYTKIIHTIWPMTFKNVMVLWYKRRQWLWYIWAGCLKISLMSELWSQWKYMLIIIWSPLIFTKLLNENTEMNATTQHAVLLLGLICKSEVPDLCPLLLLILNALPLLWSLSRCTPLNWTWCMVYWIANDWIQFLNLNDVLNG